MTSLLLLSGLIISCANEGSQSRAVLREFDEVQSLLGQAPPKSIILDVRPQNEFEAAHLPGAIRLDIKAAEALAAKPGGLSDKDAWEAWLKPLGLSAQSAILVVGDNRQLDAARAWWLLTYLGAENVALMNGDMKLWIEQKRPVTSEPTKPGAEAFEVAFRTERLATRDDVSKVLRHPDTTLVIDARSPAEHEGTVKRSTRAGRIPKACPLEWTELVDPKGRFLAQEELRSRLGKVGIKSGSTVITHCQGGGRASVDAFVMERLGYPTRNYYLGWSDWGNAPDTPIDTGPALSKSQK